MRQRRLCWCPDSARFTMYGYIVTDPECGFALFGSMAIRNGKLIGAVAFNITSRKMYDMCLIFVGLLTNQ